MMDINDPYPHDTMFKISMEIKEVARDFLEQMLPISVQNHLDLSSLKLEKNDFVDNSIGRGFVDVIFSVKMQGKIAYILVENQNKPDRFMPSRIHGYKSLIYKAHRKKYPRCKYLPSIISVVFYNCKKPEKMPRKISELTAYPDFEEMLETMGIIEHYLPDIPDEKIEEKENSSVMMMIMKHAKAQNILSIIKKMEGYLSNMAKKNFLYFQDCLIYTLKVGNHKKPKIIIEFFRNLTISKKQREAIMNMAQRLVYESKLEGKIEGKLEGIDEGIMKERHRMAKAMIAAGQDPELIKMFTRLSIEEIDSLRG